MAAASAVKPGIKGGVYRNTGTYGSPTWTEITLVKDNSGQIVWDFHEAGARQTNVKLYAKGRVDIPHTLVVRADDADAGYGALADAAVSQTAVVDLLIIDGKITTEGARGVRGEWLVNISKDEQIDGVIYPSFEIKPTWSANGYPKSVVMGASSTPTLTAF